MFSNSRNKILKFSKIDLVKNVHRNYFIKKKIIIKIITELQVSQILQVKYSALWLTNLNDTLQSVEHVSKPVLKVVL